MYSILKGNRNALKGPLIQLKKYNHIDMVVAARAQAELRLVSVFALIPPPPPPPTHPN